MNVEHSRREPAKPIPHRPPDHVQGTGNLRLALTPQKPPHRLEHERHARRLARKCLARKGTLGMAAIAALHQAHPFPNGLSLRVWQAQLAPGPLPGPRDATSSAPPTMTASEGCIGGRCHRGPVGDKVPLEYVNHVLTSERPRLRLPRLGRGRFFSSERPLLLQIMGTGCPSRMSFSAYAGYDRLGTGPMAFPGRLL